MTPTELTIVTGNSDVLELVEELDTDYGDLEVTETIREED